MSVSPVRRQEMTEEDRLIERLRFPEFYYVLDQLGDFIRESKAVKSITDIDLIKVVDFYSRTYTTPFETWYRIDHGPMTWEKFVQECKSRVTKKK
jgi:hypothetical protein